MFYNNPELLYIKLKRINEDRENNFRCAFTWVRTWDSWILANQQSTCVSNRAQLGHLYCEICKNMTKLYKLYNNLFMFKILDVFVQE